MGLANQPETSDFVALDIGNVAIAAANKDSNPNSTSSPRVTVPLSLCELIDHFIFYYFQFQESFD